MLGKKIRQIRRDRGMSLKDVAEKTGLTSSFLSQVERDLADPSITSLRKIAEALEVPIFYFLLNHEDHSPVVRRDKRKVLKFPQSHLTYELLSPDLNRKMEIMMARLEAGAVSCDEPLSHPGEECIVVLQGCMEIEIGGEVYRLEEGDSIYYYAAVPHKLWNPGDKELVFLSAMTPPLF
ncbi:MAG: cupin domain-containing protein [Thermoanaerobacteraceae bacterium]|uniref:cupin domain-containing protein n=1 Tax=Thermanaeromonas sp. C210 TaxID=2731925 RepID=UPI000E7DE714|nr:cupin domain-containing protein [Thermanaeromonas sp. C210]MBE3581948.1 cupin domain-containing protein [Thermoanaerobacteraceae bacterium]GFN22259.1 MerR family transcriptional regulator [Thermanaeromonas sp. C210]HBT46622.1 MerR family transcriptional regulator [Peptococcaceae bacterium]